MERFGGYVLLEPIAKGGMGEVWRAARVGSAGFARPIAIKRILPHLADEPDFVAMLIDEAKISATLMHPNILQVLDLGRVGKSNYYIAMEFLSGQPLNRVLATGIRQGERLPFGFCFHVVHQALMGLAHAHEKLDAAGGPMGIVHRDISPQNIMVTYQGEVKLADFGIAKATQRSSNETTGGRIKGKPGYMAPEQLQGGKVDQRLDLYAMGVVLHELLTMKRMRKADNDMQLLMEVARGSFPRFEEMGVEVPPEAAEVAYRALQPDPAARFQTAREFADALTRVGKVRGWDWTSLQVAGHMAHLFPVDMERERQSEARFNEVIAQVAQADSDGLKELLDRLEADKPTPTSGFETTRSRLLKPPRQSLWAVGLGAALLVFGGGGVMVWKGRPAAVAPAAGTLRVETVPPGASVRVNGRDIAGVTPLAVPDLAAGPTELEVRLKGHAPARQQVSLEAGREHAVTLSLSAQATEIPVVSVPSGATVLLDGRAAGTTPLTVRFQSGATVVVRVEKNGFVPLQRTINVDEAPSQLSFTLQEEKRRPVEAAPSSPTSPAPASGGKGTLALQSDPWARIYVDGKDTGKFTPQSGLSVPAGRHTIRLVNDEVGVKTEFTVTVKAGGTASVFKELK